MASFELQVLHASDLEGGVSTPEDAPRFSAIVNGLESEYPDQTLILSSGDNYIPGPFLAASTDPSLDEVLGSAGQGRGDISIMNAIGFDASAFGNHEFDLGTVQVADVIGVDGLYPGTAFPYLSANLDFSDSNLSDFVVPDGQAPQPNSIAKSVVIEVNGERIGIVGTTTPLLDSISSPGDVTVLPADPADFAALAAEVQPAVDALTGQGINKVILLSHLQQLDNEQTLAGLLEGVDLIIAGGSNTLLADPSDRLRSGDEAAGPYPILTTSASGETVAIVNTDGNYSYVGRFVAEFDENGLLVPGSIDPTISGAYATDEQGVADLRNSVENPDAVAPDPVVVEIAQAIGAIIAEKDGNLFGSTEVFLNGERGDVRTEETNLGNLTADANLAVAQAIDDTVVISIKNGGGIRASIGAVVPETGEPIPPVANDTAGKEAGDISQLDIENSLRFNNELTLVTLTAEQLVAVIEHGVAASASGATPGQFPQLSGLAFSFDPDLPAGDRIQSLAIKNADGNTLDVVVEDGELVGDPNREFRTVTLNFLAGGGDGYPFDDFAAENPERLNRVDLTALELEAGAATFADPGTEQDALAEYLAANFADESFDAADVGPGRDERIQNLNQRSDTVISEAVTPSNAITLTAIGTYETGVFDESAAEIVAYDPDTQRLFVVSANNAQINVLDASDPTNLTQAFEIDITPYGAVANSIAIQNGLVAIAVENEATQSFGAVVFFDTDGEFLNLAPVGALPDMLTFTPDGKKVLVANEGEPNTDYTFDPEGSISIIDLSGGVENLSPNDVTFVDFRGFNTQEEALTAQGVRIFGPNASVAQDLEPEYITVSEDSTTAWIALQENNAFGVLDISSGQITDILPLGFKDHSIAGNGLDVSDRDDAINIANYPNLFGVYQADGIASYEVNGETFIISANEGDSRDYDAYSEEARVADLVLDPTAFPNATDLQADEVLGRLIVTTANGDTDADGDFDKLYALGARSFSIWSTQGNLVYDSGDDFEQITASLLPEEFNSDNTENDSFDNRSDNKGPEPEGVTMGVIDGRTYAFIGFERVGGVIIYDVTNPVSPTFVQYVNNRDFAGDAAAGTAGDLGPEGLTFIAAEDSPNGKPLLAVANEVSGTTTLFEIANILNGSDGQNTFSLSNGNGDYIITEFGGVGTGARPSPAVITEVDTLKFVGEGLTAQNLLLTQEGSDLLVTFAGSQNLEVSLKNFDLEDLENLQKTRGASVDIGNILFDGQNETQDSFDVFNANQDLSKIFNRNTVTFLNDLDNNTSGWDGSNDVINGQAGNDTLRGLSGDDILRGGSGNNQLFGDEGDDILFAGDGGSTLTGGDGVDQFWIADNSLPEGTHTITDYQIGTDVIGIGGLAGVTSFSNLSITQSGADTLIGVLEQDLAILTGIQATSLNSSSFVFA